MSQIDCNHLLGQCPFGSLCQLAVYALDTPLAHKCIQSTLNRSHFDGNGTSVIFVETDGHHARPLARDNIRIHVDTTNLDSPSQYCTAVGQKGNDFQGGTLPCWETDIFTAEKKTKLLTKILPAAVAYLQGALKVDTVNTSLKVPTAKLASSSQKHIL